jgi:hypothetical protein
MKKEREVKLKEVELPTEIEIMPLRDFQITHNQYHIVIKEGVPVAIPRIFLKNMVTEKIINKIPNEG